MPLDELTASSSVSGTSQPPPAEPRTSGSPLSTGKAAPVRLDRLHKVYGDVVAVDGVSLEIEAGEFVTLLGPSGSGKTTTLMMIAGFQEVTAGSITVGHREISRLPPNKRDIGVVFQHYALFPHMRVYDNVAFPLKMRGAGKHEVESRVRDALTLVQLDGFGRRFPRQLSGGQQQRVALARAVVFEPGLALMDEPLGALDRQLREQMQVEIRNLQQSLGITVIYVTHDQEEALVMSDRIAVMNSGRVEQFADPDELYNRPATAFVATFVGESNVLRGRVDGASSPSGGTTMTTDGGMTFVGRAVESLAQGDRTVATIRPEKLVVSTADGPSTGANRLDVVCEAVTYAGQMSRYVAASRTGERFVLRVQNTPGSARFVAGQPLTLTWDVEDLRIFPADQLTDTRAHVADENATEPPT